MLLCIINTTKNVKLQSVSKPVGHALQTQSKEAQQRVYQLIVDWCWDMVSSTKKQGRVTVAGNANYENSKFLQMKWNRKIPDVLNP